MNHDEGGARPQDQASARAVWEDLAVRARLLHCPEHFVAPWRIVVLGDTREDLRLQIYGCCARLQVVVSEMIAADPRIWAPR